VNNKIGEILREEYKDTDIIGQFKSEAYAAIVLYNLSVFKDTQELLHNLVRCDDYFQEQILPKDIFRNLKLIDKIIKSDNPRKEFQRMLPNLSQQRPVGSTTAGQHTFFV